MNDELDGRVALVTGGGRGIGAAIAVRLAQEGADVAVTFQRNPLRAEDVVRRIKSIGRRAVYSMSKTALVGLTKALSRELGPRAITVNW